MKRIRYSAILLLAALLLSLTACSGLILNPDGTISGKDGTLTLGPGADTREPSTGGSLSWDTEPESETVPSIGFDEDPYEDAEHRLYVDFLKTGKSDCILIRADDKVILMDTGENDDFSAVQAALSAKNVTVIDLLILTHYDNDHIGTAARVLNSYDVKTVYMPDYIRNSSLYRKMAEALAASSAEVHRLYDEDVELDLGYAHLWINATGLPGHERGREMGSDVDNVDAEENNFSLITYLTFGSMKLLFCGDAEGERMAEYMPLWQARGLSTVTLCKIPHHGASADKGELNALDVLQPRYCVVHTDARTSLAGAIVTKMKAVFSAVYYTYDGTVSFASDGESCTIGTK